MEKDLVRQVGIIVQTKKVKVMMPKATIGVTGKLKLYDEEDKFSLKVA